jgi:hypothetical protein
MKKFFLISILGLLFVFEVNAGIPPPPTTNGTTTGPRCWPPPCIPIDGGVVLLAIAGAAYGSKQLFKSFRK